MMAGWQAIRRATSKKKSRSGGQAPLVMKSRNILENFNQTNKFFASLNYICQL
jgi:hypothetical protein